MKTRCFFPKTEWSKQMILCRVKEKVDRKKRITPVGDYGCGGRPASLGLNCL